MSDREPGRVVLCGSMSFCRQMMGLQEDLTRLGVPTLVPAAEDEIKARLSPEEFAAWKREVSLRYFGEIRAPETVAVLAVNLNKCGIPSYLGPNTFAELVIAVDAGKPIFLLQDMPELYRDELEVWGARALLGNVAKLPSMLRRSE